MYLTRMHLNPVRRGTRHLLASPQRLHAAVLLSFPPGGLSQGEEGRVLWRIDHDPPGPTLYVSSPTEPDLTHVVEQAGWPASSTGWATADTEPLRQRLTKEQAWVFRLTANPVRSIARPGGGRGKRVGHVTVGQQEGWLCERSPGWGFEVLTVAVTSRRRIHFTRSSEGTAHSVTLSLATFDGILRVTDADAFRHALAAGVGRAKGYGCGLITIAPTS